MPDTGLVTRTWRIVILSTDRAAQAVRVVELDNAQEFRKSNLAVPVLIRTVCPALTLTLAFVSPSFAPSTANITNQPRMIIYRNDYP